MQPSSPVLALKALQPDRAPSRVKSVVDQMMIEAEHYLQQNWTDVAIHDRRRLSSATFQSFLWIIRTEEQGTSLLPLSTKLKERKFFIENSYQAICPLYAFMLRCQVMYQKFGQKYKPSANKCFIIVKGKGSEGIIEPIDFHSVIEFISAGKLHWTQEGLKHVDKAC